MKLSISFAANTIPKKMFLEDVDDYIRDLYKRYGGSGQGSGMCMWAPYWRDMQFSVPNKHVSNFKRAFKRYMVKHKIKFELNF